MFPELPGRGTKKPWSSLSLDVLSNRFPETLAGSSQPLGLSPGDSGWPRSCLCTAQKSTVWGVGKAPSSAEFPHPGPHSPSRGSQQMSQLLMDSASSPVCLLLQAVPGRGTDPVVVTVRDWPPTSVTLCHGWTVAHGSSGGGEGNPHIWFFFFPLL